MRDAFGRSIGYKVIAALLPFSAAGCAGGSRATADAGVSAGVRADAGDAGVSTGARTDTGDALDGGARSDVGARSSSSSAIGQACSRDGDCKSGQCATFLAQIGALGNPAPGGYCTARCLAQSDCEAGSVCTGMFAASPGHCSAACKAAFDCRAGYACTPLIPLSIAVDGGTVTGTCQPIPMADRLADGVVGSACMTNSDCGGGSCVLTEPITGTTYPGGYCSGRCTTDADCGARGLCTPSALGGIGSCSLRCDTDADCSRDGYRCRAPGGVGRCSPGPKPLPDGVVGNACASDADCGGGPMTCSSTLGGADAPGGYCTARCAVNADCGSGGVCVEGVDIVTLLAGICIRSCTPPNGCRKGYTCLPLSGNGDSRGVCTLGPASSDAGSSP
jgi:hypothetical protein